MSSEVAVTAQIFYVQAKVNISVPEKDKKYVYVYMVV